MNDDLICRQAAIDALVEMYCKSDEDGYVWIIRGDACLRIDALPSVDAVEVVRCKDCRWKDNQDDAVKWLPCMTVAYGGNWFCADGERREE